MLQRDAKQLKQMPRWSTETFFYSPCVSSFTCYGSSVFVRSKRGAKGWEREQLHNFKRLRMLEGEKREC